MIFSNFDTDAKKILRVLNGSRKEGATIGAISGSFDWLVGRHAASFEQAKKHCDILIVLLNSDSSIRSYKGKSKPINVEGERAYFLSSLRAIDHVIVFNDLTPLRVIESLRPNIFFNASGWGPDCIESVTVKSYGGKIKIINPTLPESWNSSTSNLINKVITSEQSPSAKAVFLDRDGVMNDNGPGYIHTWEAFTFLPGVVTSLKKLQKAGYQLFIVTNQSGVGRGYYSEQAVTKLHKKAIKHLADRGVNIKKAYYCPHHPDDGCLCRKPAPGMLQTAASEHDLNLSKSWFIGDSGSDVDAGRQANVSTVLINQKNTSVYNGVYRPNFECSTITEAAKIILQT